MTRWQLIRVLALGAIVIAVGVVLGAAGWGHWGQLGLALVASVTASFGAPSHFAWRRPGRFR